MVKRLMAAAWMRTALAMIVASVAFELARGPSAIGRAQTATPASASAQVAPKTIWEGVYTKEQARRGALAYQETCAYCHGRDLGGSEVAGELAPELEGAYFLLRWGGPLSQLFVKIDDDMPKDTPGTVTSEAARDIVSYLLEVNEAQAGEAELQVDREKLKEILVTRKPPKQ